MTTADASVPSMMRAWVIDDFGGSEVFERRETNVPTLDEHQLLVRVHATSVNPVDCKIRRGGVEPLCPTLPTTLHVGVAGVVGAVGEDVAAFDEGGAVCGCAGGSRTTRTGPWPTTCRPTRTPRPTNKLGW